MRDHKYMDYQQSALSCNDTMYSNDCNVMMMWHFHTCGDVTMLPGLFAFTGHKTMILDWSQVQI